MCAVTIEQLRGETYTGSDSVVKGMYARNAKHLDEVLAGVRGGSVVPLLGAGFSAGSIPLWRGALLGWARELGPAVEDDVTRLLDAGDFERAASLVESETGANAFRDAFRGTFGEGVLDGAFDRLTPERRGIPSAFRGFVLTTNYDRLIERAYEVAGAPIERVCPHTAYQFAQAAGGVQGNGRLLLKLHGDAWDPTNAVITREDYKRVYETDGEVAPLVEVMRRAFTGRRVLFLGCSLAGDRPLDVLHGCCEGATHYALVELPAGTENPDDPLVPALVDAGGRQVPAYREARLRLDELGIRPIWYPRGRHEALDALLGWLEGELGPLPGGAAARLASIPESTYGIVGREDEVGEVVASLSGKPSITLVTGPGGIGKTEVCREALRRLRDSGRDVVYAVTVGASTAWAQCDAVADALGVSRMEQREGVRVANYASHLADSLSTLERPVVYLDNWEDAWVASDEEGRKGLVGLLWALRDGGASVLASSREAATDYETGARIIRFHELRRKPSVALFREVLDAKGGGPDPSTPEFEKLIGELEGHPLAIVLTATLAANSLSWGDVLSHWTESSQHAKNPRHNSLETALRLSWDAVADSPLACDLWGVMALTPGDLPRAELDALASLSGANPDDWMVAYARLRDASLISTSEDGSLSMLRPVREAFFRLADGNLVDRCLELLTERLVGIFEADGDGSGAMSTGPAHGLALASLPRALFFLGCTLNLQGLNAGSSAFARELSNYYQFDWEASRPVLDALLRAARDARNDSLVSFAALKAAQCAIRLGDLDGAGALLEDAERLHRLAGDDLGTAYDLRSRAELAMLTGDLDGAGALLEDAERLHRLAGDDFGTAYDLLSRAELSMRLDRFEEATPLLEDAERLHRQMGDDLGTANDLQFRAELAMLTGDLDGAGPLLEEAERLHRRVGSDRGMANDLLVRARLALLTGGLDRVGLLLEKAERLHRRVGNDLGMANGHLVRSSLLALQGDFDRALSELAKAEELYESMGDGYSLELAHETYEWIEQMANEE